MSPVKRLEAQVLSKRCDPEQFKFETTDELPELDEIIGQARAVDAVQFGIGMKRQGYNIFALGPEGAGKRTILTQFFENAAASEPIPADWVYVNNFQEQHKSRALRLPAGKGMEFRQDMEEFIDEVRTALATAFESDEYRARMQEIETELEEQQGKTLEELGKRAKEKGLAMIRTPTGLVFAPVREGEVMSPEEIQSLSEEERGRLEEEASGLQEELQEILLQLPRIQREIREKVKDLNREVAEISVGGLMGELNEKYGAFPEIIEHLDAVQEDIVANIREIIGQEGEGERPPIPIPGSRLRQGSPYLRRYQVNLLVDHSQSQGAPVIYEDNPTYQNLTGRVEHIAQMGALITDFNLIKPGALHRANGGYLILEAYKVLTQPYAWEGLKRALQSGQMRVESPGQMMSLISTVSLEPEPIPLDVKVALIGDPLLYYQLNALDPDFGELFRVAADFDEVMEWNPDNQKLYARLIGNLVRKDHLRPFDRCAVARVLEQSARMVEDGERLTTQMREIANLLREADHWAEAAGRDLVGLEDVQKAIDAQIYRSDRLRERVQENILRETILIDTEGEVVGQVNALSVLQLGDFAFGRPSRITANVRMGGGEVVDIEREVELGGPIHAKGVLILSSFLGGRYAHEHPLSLSASIVFEQSYGEVDGDSASSTELYALLSAIADVPIKQSLAVTGSVNQHGQVQAIGGVNEKIEGFFDICKARGLTRDQGVLIPVSNIKHLMLRQDVVDAVSEGKFHIYPIETIDQGIEMLTGIPAGEADSKGAYPEDSLNGLVQAKLSEFAERRAAFVKSQEDDSE
jgi:lon-related putative ATP-dependent protease